MHVLLQPAINFSLLSCRFFFGLTITLGTCYTSLRTDFLGIDTELGLVFTQDNEIKMVDISTDMFWTFFSSFCFKYIFVFNLFSSLYSTAQVIIGGTSLDLVLAIQENEIVVRPVVFFKAQSTSSCFFFYNQVIAFAYFAANHDRPITKEKVR